MLPALVRPRCTLANTNLFFFPLPQICIPLQEELLSGAHTRRSHCNNDVTGNLPQSLSQVFLVLGRSNPYGVFRPSLFLIRDYKLHKYLDDEVWSDLEPRVLFAISPPGCIKRQFLPKTNRACYLFRCF